MGRSGRLTAMFVLLAATACQPDESDEDAPRTIRQPISQVVEGRAEPAIRLYNRGSESEALRSHAVGFFGPGNCTATWIGPNTAVTAAHCGGAPDGSGVFIRMEWYPGVDALGDAALDQTNSMRKDYACSRKLATAFRASNADLAVWECGVGETPAPGDRFGWVDYSIFENDQKGDSVYSIWFNPVDTNPEWRSIRLYSAGQIVKTDQLSWAAPNCVTSSPKRLPFVHRTNVFSAGGASGSLQLSPVTHTAVIGPTSTGNSSTRNASAMAQILNKGFLPPGERYRVETDLDPSRDPATVDDNGCGLPDELQNARETDSNGNLVLDVQEGVDRSVTQRPIYYLSFDDRWRRLLWETGPGFESVQPAAPPGRIDIALLGRTESADASGFVPALRHRRISLAQNTRYDVRLQTQAAQRTAVKVRLSHQGEDRCPADQSSAVVPGANARSWTTFTVQTGDCSEYMLDIWLEPNRLVLLANVLVAERDAVWTFENWDEREPWTTVDGGHALIYENGKVGNPGHIFAGQATGGSDVDNIRHRTLALGAIPIHPSERYRLTFDARDAWPEQAIGIVEVGKNRGSPALRAQFSPQGREWQSFRFQFTSGSEHGEILDFSVMGRGRISVDNVRLELCENGVCP